MPSQPLVQGPGLAWSAHISVQFRPVLLAVILDAGMNELVQNDIVHQIAGQGDEVDVQTDIVEMRATAPACALISYIDSIV